MLEIELDVFSGRPNPRWSLSNLEEAEVRRAWSRGQACEHPLEASDLGFRGFLVYGLLPDGPVRVLNRRWLTAEGRSLGDEGSLHASLADAAKRQGHADLLA